VRQFYNNQVPMKKGLHLRQRLQRADFPGKRRFELSHRHFIECHRRPGNELNTPWKKERGQPACEFPAG
jgi:hypothetical protein